MVKRSRSGDHRVTSSHLPHRRNATAAAPQETLLEELHQLRDAYEALHAEAAELRATVAEAEVLLGRNFQRSKVFRKLRCQQEAPFVGPTAPQGPAAMRQLVRKAVAEALKNASVYYGMWESVDRSAVLLEEAVVSHDVVPSLVFEFVVAPFVECDIVLYAFDERRQGCKGACLLLPGHAPFELKCEILRALCPDDVLSTEKTAAEEVVDACSPRSTDCSSVFTSVVVSPVIKSMERDAVMGDTLATFLFRYLRSRRLVDYKGKAHPLVAPLADILAAKATELFRCAPCSAASSRFTLSLVVTMIEQIACANGSAPSPLHPSPVTDLLVDVFGSESVDSPLRVSLIRIFRAVVFDRSHEYTERFESETFRDQFLLPAAQFELAEDAIVDLLDGVCNVEQESCNDLKGLFCIEAMRDRFCIPLAARVRSDEMACSLLRCFHGFLLNGDYGGHRSAWIAEHPGVVFATPSFRDHFFAHIAPMVDDSQTAFLFLWNLAWVLKFAARTTPHPFVTNEFGAAVRPVLQIARQAEFHEADEDDDFICSVLDLQPVHGSGTSVT